MRKLFILNLLFLLILFSCNKEKMFSRRLMKGETWRVLSITIDGLAPAFTGEWQVTSDVDIYDSIPSVQWTFENQDASFEWQFQDKGKTFQLNYKHLCSEPTALELDDLDYFCNDISGTYKVIDSGTGYMEFNSTTTQSYGGQVVEIRLKKK